MAGAWRPELPRREAWVAAAVLVLAVFAAYANTFRVPLLLDDRDAIVGAFAGSHRSWLATALAPATDTAGSGGRPLLHLSFALNHAWSGEAVGSYHVVNLLIHAAAALTLFGLVRRTLLLPSLAGNYGAIATRVSFFIAALWALHPVQTESVTYLSQRAESLAGFFYLFTLYAFVRSTASGQAGRWRLASIAACWCGMATKEIVVTAPVAVLLYDRVFVSQSLRESVARRWRYFAALAASWLWLGVLMSTSHLTARGVGFEQGVTWFNYARAETKVIVSYAKLAIWPHPLVFDYGPEWIAREAAVVWPDALVIVGALGMTLWLWAKSPRAAFSAAAFFLLLAPTSSVVPLAGQPMAESRMYLPLAALIAGVVPTACRELGRKALPGFGLLVLVLAGLTVSRNQTYQNAADLWEDTLAKHAVNSRAHNNLAVELATMAGREAEAVAHYEEALRINPGFAEAHDNLGAELVKSGARTAEAIAHFEKAIRLNPRLAKAHYNLGRALAPLPGRAADARRHAEEALRLRPDDADAHNNLAVLLAQLPGRMPEALKHYAEALRLRPDYAEARNNYANDLAKLPGRQAEALAEYEAALKSQPDFVAARVNLANELARIAGRQSEAEAQYREAFRFDPDNAAAHLAYGKTLMAWGRGEAAIQECQAALRNPPAPDGARRALADAFAIAGRIPEAVTAYQEILQAQRTDPEVFYNLGVLQQQMGRGDEAAKNFESALALNARHVGALHNLGVVWRDRGEPAKAVEYFKTALALNPNLEAARSFVLRYQEKK